MLTQLNRIEICGCVGSVKTQKVEDRTLASITVATNFAYKGIDGTPIIETTWHMVRAWKGPRIDESILTSLGRGDQVRIIGRIRNQRYASEDGTERTTCEVIAASIERIEGSERLQCEN